MKIKAEKITLGGRKFDLPERTFEQTAEILDALDEMEGKTAGALLRASLMTVFIGLRGSYPDLKIDELMALKGSVPEVNAAVAAVIRAARLSQEGEEEPQPAAD